MQLLCMLVLAPLMATQQGLAFNELPGYFMEGVRILGGNAGVPNPTLIRQWIPLVYIAWNIFFNVVAIVGLRVAGAATMTLFMTASVPMAIFGFTFTLPLIGQAPPLAARYEWICRCMRGVLVMLYARLLQ
jgi:hypothetical protein